MLASQRVQAQALIGDIELRSGRFVSLARRPTDEGEVVLLSDVTEAHLMQSFLDRQQRLLTLGELASRTCTARSARPWRRRCCTQTRWRCRIRTARRSRAAQARTVERLRELDKLITEMLAFTRQRQPRARERERAARAGGAVAAAGTGDGGAADHRHRGAGSHRAGQRALARLRGAEPRDQCPAGGRPGAEHRAARAANRAGRRGDPRQ